MRLSQIGRAAEKIPDFPSTVEAQVHSTALAKVRLLFHLDARHPHRSAQVHPTKNTVLPVAYQNFTKPGQSTGPENIAPERPLPAPLAPRSVNSPPRITL